MCTRDSQRQNRTVLWKLIGTAELLDAAKGSIVKECVSHWVISLMKPVVPTNMCCTDPLLASSSSMTCSLYSAAPASCDDKSVGESLPQNPLLFHASRLGWYSRYSPHSIQLGWADMVPIPYTLGLMQWWSSLLYTNRMVSTPISPHSTPRQT